MHKFIFRRILMMLPVLLGVMFVIFTLVYITPGDSARILLGERAPIEAINALRQEMGLDRPFLVQFAGYITRVVRFDLGTSFSTGRPVFDELSFRVPSTALLGGFSLLVAILIGIPMGIACAIRHNSILDSVASVLGLLALSVPNFWLGLMLILLFSVNLGWLPVSGFATPLHWILPSFTIGLSLAGELMRFTRSSMLEVIRQDYIRTAWAKGQKESTIIIKHALKNALIPLITVIGLCFGGLMGGAVLTETIFAIPGVGGFMVQSIASRDYPIIQGGVLMFAIIFSVVNLLVDILYGFVDPRIRSQYK
jgi:peptide/nickel transport system permease protein